jgi:fatty-acid desaturase
VENYVNPNYSQYFTYAFIFTVVHILILVVATAPKDVQIMPIAYIISGMLAILIAFKR